MVFVLTSLFVITARAAEVTLTWDHNEPLPDGYRLFMRIDGSEYNYATPVWQGTDNTCSIDGLQPATKYFFVVRAFVKEDESGDSNEVDYKPPVSAPANLRINIEISVLIDVNGVPYISSNKSK